ADDERHPGLLRKLARLRRRIDEQRAHLCAQRGGHAVRLSLARRQTTQLVDQLLRRANADVAFDQNLLEPLEGLVFRAAAAQGAPEPSRERAAALREPAPQALAVGLDARRLGGARLARGSFRRRLGRDFAMGFVRAPRRRASARQVEQRDDDRNRPRRAPQDERRGRVQSLHSGPSYDRHALAASPTEEVSRPESETETTCETPGSGMVTP